MSSQQKHPIMLTNEQITLPPSQNAQRTHLPNPTVPTNPSIFHTQRLPPIYPISQNNLHQTIQQPPTRTLPSPPSHLDNPLRSLPSPPPHPNQQTPSEPLSNFPNPISHLPHIHPSLLLSAISENEPNARKSLPLSLSPLSTRQRSLRSIRRCVFVT